MGQVDQTAYKSQLLELRKRLSHEVEMAEEALREDVSPPGEVSAVPSHPADVAVEGFDKEVAIAQNEEQMLEDVEGALERLEEGRFGICEECGKEIGRQRLAAVPYARLCIQCAQEQHLRRRSPK
jgi:RNA polymerase-binding protein DksA